MNISRKNILVCLISLPLAFSARANHEKTPFPLQGYVTDAITKKPVPGVLVSASAPNTNVPKEAVTDEDGFFSFEQLPANQINLQFDKKGYQPVKKTGILIKDKAVARIYVEFNQEESAEDRDDSEYPLLHVLQMD